MIPIRLIETEREDFEGPVIELWRDRDFVGFVFFDGETTILQVYPDGEGDVHDLDVNELQTLLDTAVRMVDPDAFDSEMDELREAAAAVAPSWGNEHPATVALLAEFDPLALHRTEDGEGFFKRSIAGRFITKAEELDLAVTEMDGFDLVADELTPIADLQFEVADQPMMTWSEFRAFANTSAHNALTTWPSRDSVVVAFVFKQPDGAEIVA